MGETASLARGEALPSPQARGADPSAARRRIDKTLLQSVTTRPVHLGSSGPDSPAIINEPPGAPARPSPHEVSSVGHPAHRVVRHRRLVDPVGGHHRPLEDPVRARRHPLRRAAARSARRSRRAPDERPVPRGQRAAGVHRGRGRADRGRRPHRTRPHRRDDGSGRAGRDALPRGPPARYPGRSGGRRVVGSLRPDGRWPDGPAHAAARAAQAVRPVLAVDRVDDPGPDDQGRRQLQPRAHRRKPVPAPLDLRPRRRPRREVRHDRLRKVVQPRVRRPDAVGPAGLAERSSRRWSRR